MGQECRVARNRRGPMSCWSVGTPSYRGMSALHRSSPSSASISNRANRSCQLASERASHIAARLCTETKMGMKEQTIIAFSLTFIRIRTLMGPALAKKQSSPPPSNSPVTSFVRSSSWIRFISSTEIPPTYWCVPNLLASHVGGGTIRQMTHLIEP